MSQDRRIEMTRVAAALVLSLACGGAHAVEAPARYSGMLPCADCPALRMDLALRKDASGKPATYEQKMTYVDRRGKDVVMRSAGRWEIVRGSAAEPNATLYRLTEARSHTRELLRVEGEQALRLVDDDGRDIPSPRPQVLWRTDAAAGPVTVGKSEANRTIALKPGQELVVRLAGNPTTGYRWAMADGGEPVVAITATPAYKPDAAAQGMVGVGGVETWRFLAFRPGPQRLTFEYRRPWEQNATPAETVSFAIDVTRRSP